MLIELIKFQSRATYSLMEAQTMMGFRMLEMAQGVSSGAAQATRHMAAQQVAFGCAALEGAAQIASPTTAERVRQAASNAGAVNASPAKAPARKPAAPRRKARSRARKAG